MMLKKTAFLLLISVLINSTPLFTFNNTSTHQINTSCEPVEAAALSTSNVTDTYTYIYCPIEIGEVRNQFRYRKKGDSLWRFSSLRATYYRFLGGLSPSTEYEFQISYQCADGWSDFSESATFTTTGETMPIDMEDTGTTSTDNEEPNTINTESISTDTEDVLDTVAIDMDHPNDLPSLSISNVELYCGDSTLCINVHSNLDSLVRLQFAINWDTSFLKLLSITPGLIVDSISIPLNLNAMDEENSNPIIIATDPISKIIDPILSTKFIIYTNEHQSLETTKDLMTLCFTPRKHGTSSIAFAEDIPIQILLFNNSLGIDTLTSLILQAGTIIVDNCEGVELGGGTCTPINGNGLSTSTLEERNTYIYTSQAKGAVNNQFRYREAGTERWIYTDISNIYFRRITGLNPGTTYEYQVNQQCPDSTYSDYSISFSFTTLGSNNNAATANANHNESTIINNSSSCEPVSSEDLSVSTIKQYFAYVYTPQPYGIINNQFRYRVLGKTFWLYTNISTTYYRYLHSLEDGQMYEYQVSHECEPGVWSRFSDSYIFETLPSINLTSDNPGKKAVFSAKAAGNNRNEITLFPNPATDLITLSMTQFFSTEDQLTLLDLNGQTIRHIAPAIGEKQQAFRLNDLAVGVYFVRFQSGMTTQMYKFVKW